MSQLETIAYIAAPSVIILFGLILILISQITAPDPYTPPNPPRHQVTHSEADVIEGIVDDVESYVQVGRRGRYSVARHVRVPDDWRPYIGDLRITILQQSTAEFLFIRKTVSQLTDPFQRAQWTTDLATIA